MSAKLLELYKTKLFNRNIKNSWQSQYPLEQPEHLGTWERIFQNILKQEFLFYWRLFYLKHEETWTTLWTLTLATSWFNLQSYQQNKIKETNFTGQDCSGKHSKRKLFTLISQLWQTQSTKRSKKCHNHYLLQERILQHL